MRQPQSAKVGSPWAVRMPSTSSSAMNRPTRRRGLNPRRVEAALVLWRVFGDVNRGAAIFAAEREALTSRRADQDDRRDDAGRCIGRQQADEECADAHQGHRDEEGVFAADDVAQAAEEQRAERAHREAGGESEKREDECRRRIDAGEELRRQNGRRACRRCKNRTTRIPCRATKRK